MTSGFRGWQGYALAVGATGAALAIRLLLDPSLHDQVPYALFFVAVAATAWRADFGASFLAVLLGGLAADWFFMPPRHAFLLPDIAQVVGMATYFVSSLALVGFGQGMQRARRRAEAAAIDVATQEERLRVTLSSIGDAVIATDTAGAVTYMNPIAVALTGWTAAEAAGQPLATVFQIIHEHTRQPAENPVERVLRDGRIAGLANHTLLLARDGRETPIADSAAPIRDRTGQIAGVVMVFRDQSEERLVETRLRQSEAQKVAVLNSSLDAIIAMDSAGLIVEFNPAAERMFGRRAADVIGRSLAEVIIPERLRASHHQGLARYLATGAGPVLGQRIEMPALGPDGAEFPVELSINRISDIEPPRFSGFIRDITGRKLAENNQRERERLAALRAEVASQLISGQFVDMILQRCCELLVQYLDAAFARIWTLDAIEPVLNLRASAGLYTHLNGPHARVPVGQFKIGRIAEHLQPLLTNDVQHDPNISDPDWAKREGMTAFAGFPLVAQGRLYGVVALFSRTPFSPTVLGDLAPLADSIALYLEREHAERQMRIAKEQAEAASSAKDDFLAALSHELRTPLNPALMSAAALAGDERLPPDIRADLQMIERNIALEARLIDDLLDLTRISRGRLQLRPEPCDAHSLIALAAEIVRDDVREKQQKLELQLVARRCGVIGDPARLQQIFWNLLRNAVKFTPSGGQITVRTRDLPSDRLCLEVSDSGIGIPSEMVERIFRPFDQGSLENDHRFGGLGLGLAIARMLVGLHGGTIRAESAGRGRGSNFIVELPGTTLPVAIGPAPHLPVGDEPAHIIPPMSLLLVEDHEATLLVLQRLLTRSGHRVTIASTVAEALRAASSQRFDAVISDLGLPDGTGIELMEQLRTVYNLRGIALSGYGMEEDVRRSEAAGFVTHLIKPVDFQHLRRALHSLNAAAPPDGGDCQPQAISP